MLPPAPRAPTREAAMLLVRTRRRRFSTSCGEFSSAEFSRIFPPYPREHRNRTHIWEQEGEEQFCQDKNFYLMLSLVHFKQWCNLMTRGLSVNFHTNLRFIFLLSPRNWASQAKYDFAEGENWQLTVSSDPSLNNQGKHCSRKCSKAFLQDSENFTQVSELHIWKEGTLLLENILNRSPCVTCVWE